MTRYIPEAPILSLVNRTYNTVTLGWTDISRPGIPIVGYKLYRGNGASPTSFSLLIQLGAVLQYVDNTVVSGQTYTYYIVGIYNDGLTTPGSNWVTVLVPYAIEYIYGYRSDGQISVLSVADINNPSIAATVNLGLDATGCQTMVQDDKYLYLLAGTPLVSNKLYVIDWATNKFSPSLKKTMINKSGAYNGSLLVRRGLSTRNNLMFLLNNTNQIESWDITDPENPTLIQAVGAPVGVPNGRGFAYEPSTNRIYSGYRAGGSGYFYIPVNADGTFGSGVGVVLHPTFDLIFNGTAVSEGHFWSHAPQDPNSIYYGYVIPGGTVDAGISFITTSVGWFPGRFKAISSDSTKIILRDTADSHHHPVTIWSTIPTVSGVIHAQLGGLNNICGGFVTLLNYIYFFVNNFLYIYDITNRDSPSLVSSLNLGATYINFSAFPDDSWYGNNGLCVA